MRMPVHSDVRMLRAQVLLLIVGGLVIVGLLWALVVLPLREEKRSCQNEIRSIEEEVRSFQLRMDEGGLANRLSMATARNRQLNAEWSRLRESVDTFRDREAIREALPTYADGRIDFKVALFETRQQLTEHAASAGVSIPEDLGIAETIGTEERAKLRLWQLAATVRLATLAIDSRIPEISVIKSGAPVAFSLDDASPYVAMEFPTHLVLRCSFQHLVAFLDSLSREGSFYALRKVRIERMDDRGPRMLAAEIVAGAFLFHRRSDMDEPVKLDPTKGRRRGAESVRTDTDDRRGEGQRDG